MPLRPLCNYAIRIAGTDIRGDYDSREMPLNLLLCRLASEQLDRLVAADTDLLQALEWRCPSFCMTAEVLNDSEPVLALNVPVLRYCDIVNNAGEAGESAGCRALFMRPFAWPQPPPAAILADDQNHYYASDTEPRLQAALRDYERGRAYPDHIDIATNDPLLNFDSYGALFGMGCRRLVIKWMPQKQLMQRMPGLESRIEKDWAGTTLVAGIERAYDRTLRRIDVGENSPVYYFCMLLCLPLILLAFAGMLAWYSVKDRIRRRFKS